jgi:serine/threonine-protein kinase
VPITEVRPDIPPALVPVLNKLMAHKPADRFQTGEEAAQALQALLRPRSKSSGSSPASSSVTKPSAPPPEPIPQPAPHAAPVLIVPRYPGWFKPLASFVEEHPTGAIATIVTTILGLLAVGFVLGRLLR